MFNLSLRSGLSPAEPRKLGDGDELQKGHHSKNGGMGGGEAGNCQNNGSNSTGAVMHRVTLCLWKAFGRKAVGSRGVRESDGAKIRPGAFLVWVLQQSLSFFFNRPNEKNPFYGNLR